MGTTGSDNLLSCEISDLVVAQMYEELYQSRFKRFYVTKYHADIGAGSRIHP